MFGFLEASVASIEIEPSTKNLFNEWVNNNLHGEMAYLKRNTNLRFEPATLFAGTVSVICVKVPYLNSLPDKNLKRNLDLKLANISSYAHGRDYHKVIKNQLKQYAIKINQLIINYGLDLKYRAFTDSAPILEVELAKNAGLGWRGKNTLLINKNQGSMFFLGELFTNLPLIPGSPSKNHCGSCNKCIEICPTKAFISPYQLDSRRCISYLTIEFKGIIPIEFRKAIGNRIYGCDDCQSICPWNKFSKITNIEDFKIRHNLDKLDLVEAFNWDEITWKNKMQGSSIYRIGYIQWMRNISIALGNAPSTLEVISALKSRINFPSEIVQEHVKWALDQHQV